MDKREFGSGFGCARVERALTDAGYGGVAVVGRGGVVTLGGALPATDAALAALEEIWSSGAALDGAGEPALTRR